MATGINEYQAQAMTTCMPTCDNFAYMSINLQAEVGEFLGKIAKHIRKGEAFIDDNRLYFKRSVPAEAQEALMDEGGDIFWQLMGLYKVMGWDAEMIANRNLAKLRDRANRNVIDGDGDCR